MYSTSGCQVEEANAGAMMVRSHGCPAALDLPDYSDPTDPPNYLILMTMVLLDPPYSPDSPDPHDSSHSLHPHYSLYPPDTACESMSASSYKNIFLQVNSINTELLCGEPGRRPLKILFHPSSGQVDDQEWQQEPG